jgi:hypothetical protein
MSSETNNTNNTPDSPALIDPAIIKELTDKIRSVVAEKNISSALGIVKVSIEVVEGFVHLKGVQKTDYAISALTALCNEIGFLDDAVAETLRSMLANGIVADTIKLVVDASKGGLSLNKLMQVGGDVVGIVEDVVASSSMGCVGSLMACVNPKTK